VPGTPDDRPGLLWQVGPRPGTGGGPRLVWRGRFVGFRGVSGLAVLRSVDRDVQESCESLL